MGKNTVVGAQVGASKSCGDVFATDLDDDEHCCRTATTTSLVRGWRFELLKELVARSARGECARRLAADRIGENLLVSGEEESMELALRALSLLPECLPR